MALPNAGTSGLSARGVFPLQTIQISATYQINGGTAIAAGASISETKTFTGVKLTDPPNQVAVGFDPAVLSTVPGLTLTGAIVTAADTIQLTWTNFTAQSITPPATSQQFWAVRLAPFY